VIHECGGSHAYYSDEVKETGLQAKLPAKQGYAYTLKSAKTATAPNTW
jgi:hypothetical protein